MGRGKRVKAVAWLLACMVTASAAYAWTPVKHFGEDKYVHGVIQAIDLGGRTMTILADPGSPVQVRFQEDTVFIVRDRQIQGADLREGMTVTVRCVSVLGQEVREDGGLCPIAVIADRVVLEGPVAVSSEVSPSPDP